MAASIQLVALMSASLLLAMGAPIDKCVCCAQGGGEKWTSSWCCGSECDGALGGVCACHGSGCVSPGEASSLMEQQHNVSKFKNAVKASVKAPIDKCVCCHQGGGEKWTSSWCPANSICDGALGGTCACSGGCCQDPRPLKPRAIVSWTVCLRLIYSGTGGSSGHRKVETTQGSSYTKTLSQQTKVEINSDIQASAGNAFEKVSAKVSTNFMNAVESTVSQNMYSSQKITTDVDFSKPCYLYQGRVTVTYDDHLVVNEQGAFEQFNTPQDPGCHTIKKSVSELVV